MKEVSYPGEPRINTSIAHPRKVEDTYGIITMVKVYDVESLKPSSAVGDIKAVEEVTGSAYEEMVAWRRYFHANPELSLGINTAEKVKEVLASESMKRISSVKSELQASAQ